MKFVISKRTTWNLFSIWHFKDFSRRTASDEILNHKGFNIARNQKYDRYQSGPLSKLYNFGVTVKNEIMENKELVEKLEQPIIRKSEKKKNYAYIL